jgi:hypothetical protein
MTHLAECALAFCVLCCALGADTDATLNGQLHQEGGVSQKTLTKTCTTTAWTREGGVHQLGSRSSSTFVLGSLLALAVLAALPMNFYFRLTLDVEYVNLMTAATSLVL